MSIQPNFHDFDRIVDAATKPFSELPIHILALYPIISTIKTIFPWINPYLDCQINTITSGFTVFLGEGYKINVLLLNVGNTVHLHRKTDPPDILTDRNFKYSVFFQCLGKTHKLTMSSRQEDLIGGISKIMNLMIASAPIDIFFEFGIYRLVDQVIHEKSMYGEGCRIPSKQPFWMNPNKTAIRIKKKPKAEYFHGMYKFPFKTWFWLKEKNTFRDKGNNLLKPKPYEMIITRNEYIPKELA